VTTAGVRDNIYDRQKQSSIQVVMHVPVSAVMLTIVIVSTEHCDRRFVVSTLQL